MSSINPFRRQQPDRPTLRQRAASLKAGLARSPRPAEPTVASQPVVGLAVSKATILSRIAQHRIARDRWTDSVLPADRAWRLQHGRDVSVEAVAAAEAARDAADARVTATWNSLFETPPASSAELLALLRHAQHYVDEDHAPDAAIELSGMVRAIGDAVETLRAQPFPEFEAELSTASSDRFLIDLAPTLLPLLDGANAEWAKVQALYKQAEEACGKGPESTALETAYQSYRGKFDVALIASGYTAAWEAIQPLFERIEAMVGPLMNVPVQSLKGLILKQRIGQTLPHYEDDAAKDLAKLAKAYKPGETASQCQGAVDWHSPPPGFMASPAIEPFSFARIPDAIGLELDRLHGIAVAEFKRRGGPEKSEAEQVALRRELHLDELNYVPPREGGTTAGPVIDGLSAKILALWPAWAAHTGDDGTDEQTAAYEAMQERRFALLHAADALPVTVNNILPKAIALAWLHYVNEWRLGLKREDYSTDGRLAIDIHMAALAQGELPKRVNQRPELDLVGMLDLASASLENLQALHDLADLVGGVAYAAAWSGRCQERSHGDNYNAAGKLMQWLGDALTDVETAANKEARRRRPTDRCDRETRLEMLALPVIQNGDPDETEAFARELLAHAQAERAGR